MLDVTKTEGVVVLPINLYQKAVEFLVRFLGLAKLDIVVDFNNDYLVGKEGVTHFNSILPFTRRSFEETKILEILIASNERRK